MKILALEYELPAAGTETAPAFCRGFFVFGVLFRFDIGFADDLAPTVIFRAQEFAGLLRRAGGADADHLLRAGGASVGLRGAVAPRAHAVRGFRG